MMDDPASVHEILSAVLTQIDTWPRAAVMITAIVAFVILRRSKTTRDDVKTIKKTLTSNNGGSHIKDALDRIEADQQKQIEQLNGLATRVTSLEVRKWWRR